jgi:anaphase-promoting complex subunit 2
VLGADATNSDSRAEVDRWCEELEQHLISVFAKKRIDEFWDMIVEYPYSKPALHDLRFCLARFADSSLHNRLVETAKKVLAAKLHRAGTRTEDILTALVNAIRSLCVLFSKNEQGAVVFAVVGDTLQHLRQRKDSVSAVVQDITQDSAESILYSDLRAFAMNAEDSEGTDDDDQDGELSSTAMLQRSRASTGNWKYHRRPDVLRVLLSTLSVSAVIEEYKSVLASRLLAKPMHDFDTIKEEEVLERMKCVFGEDSLASCMVMVRDIQASRRYNNRIHTTTQAQREGRKISELKMDVSILSATCWPPASRLALSQQEGCCSSGSTGGASQYVPPAHFNPHPTLQELMDAYRGEFKKMKPNQCLKWVYELGTVAVELKQENPSTRRTEMVEVELSLFAASIVLHVRDGLTTVAAISAAMMAPQPSITGKCQQLHPNVLLLSQDHQRVALQTSVVSSTTAFTFEEEEAADARPSGFTGEQLDMICRSVTSLLKARGQAKTVAEIHNSLKMFNIFQGSAADLKRALLYLVSDGKLATADGTTFAVQRTQMAPTQ